MDQEDRYVPLAERLNQDVMHDNFVPKYRALASVQPSKLILVGVWMIFASPAFWKNSFDGVAGYAGIWRTLVVRHAVVHNGELAAGRT